MIIIYMIKYTFVHPTKSGGTSVDNYFAQHYKDYITNMGHEGSCKNDNNSIIIVRDVNSRFLSMYKYWKNGSERYRLNQNLKNKRKDVSILDFIHLIKNNKTQLYSVFTWNQHFDNTTTWIDKDTDYKNIIIVRYEKNLNNKIQTLINKLGIPNKNIILPCKNVSIPVSNEHELIQNKEVQTFITDYFKDDIEFIHKIETTPEIFKLVI